MLAQATPRIPEGSPTGPATAALGMTVVWSALAVAVLLALLFAVVRGVRDEGSAGASRQAGGIASRGLVSLPLTAQAAVSAAVGADNRAYAVSARRGALTASSPGQRLELRFDRAGVALRSGATQVDLSLQGVGYGSSPAAVANVAPRASGNRVVYSRAGLTEWYVNGPLGLEQGFTVARAPVQHPASPLTLSIALSGDAHPALAADAQSVDFNRAGRHVLSYGGLSASDARGRILHSWLALSGGHVLLRVDARGARYPLRIDPFVRQGEKLVGSGLSGPYGYIGMSVALSADGDTALVGAPADGTSTEYRGAAFVFVRSGSTWIQQGEKLTGGSEVGGAWFGESVALSADGDTALIGGPTDNGATGAAWVFTRSGSTWTQQGAKLTGGDEVGEGFFAKNVALSADGDTALIGGYNDNEHRGAAWVFTRSGSAWTQQGEKLTGGGQPGFFGWGVALSGDGNTALIGEWGLEGGVGAAWVFTRSGSTWAKQGVPLTAGEGSGYSWFGYSTALSSDGSTAVVGAPHGDEYAGEGFVFTRSGSKWSRQGVPLEGGEEVNDEDGGELGYSAALSSDGDVALLGGRVDSFFHGAAWAFARTGSTWTQYGAKLTGSEETSNREEFGWSVALSASGDAALVGSPCDKACVGSATAFANGLGAPEFGRCTKGAKGSGDYADSGCTKPGGSDSHEWTPGVAGAGFTIELAAGSVTLETVDRSKITCAGETGAGHYAENKGLAGVVLTLTGCIRSGEACSGAGAHAGEIVSGPLDGTLGVEKLGASAGKDKVGLALFPAAETGPLFEFACGANTISIRGSVIVPLKADKVSKTSTLRFKASKGRQKPEAFVGAAKDVLEESLDNGPYEQVGLAMTSTQTSEEPLEANAVL